MPEHYFTENPSSKHRSGALRIDVLGRTFEFDVDAGVFSRGGLDFGSRLLLESLPPLSGRIADLGCGWGAIGVALAKANPDAYLILCDINRRAVDLSRGNLIKNGVQNACALQSNGLEDVEDRLDAVVTNPPIRAGKHLVYSLFDQAREHLTPDGSLYAVIRKHQGAPSALRHLEETYGRARVIARDKGFWVIRAAKEGSA